MTVSILFSFPVLRFHLKNIQTWTRLQYSAWENTWMAHNEKEKLAVTSTQGSTVGPAKGIVAGGSRGTR